MKLRNQMACSIDAGRISVLSGNAPYRTGIDDAVAQRARQLIDTRSAFARRGGNYLYDGNRTKPENLGWRFLQMNESGIGDSEAAEIAAQIGAGKWDAQIADTYHDAASAEWHYRYEKDW